MLDYVHTGYTPLKDEVVCEYYVRPHPTISFETAAQNIAKESSIGTWTDISTMNPEVATRLRPTVFYINTRSKRIKIAYPMELFEMGNIPQMLSSIAGNIYGMKALDKLRLLDVHFPKKMLRAFKGPHHGIKGIRKLLRVQRRPLTGTIVKPKVGLSPQQHADVAYEAWSGGLDIVKDDENLTSMSFNSFEERIKLTLKAREEAQKKTGEYKMYMPNITAETDEMIRRAEYVKKMGGEYIMIDILTTGFAGLQTIRNLNLGLAIHAHRAGHGAITRDPEHGLTMLTIAKLARLIGVDQLHIGTVVGKMEGSAIEVHEIEEEIDSEFIPAQRKSHHLEQSWDRIQPVFPVCSGGLHPGHVPKLLKLMGKNIIAQFGGGCHGHPDGTYAGAKAIRQAVSAAMRNQTLETAAKRHPELARVLEKFGKK